ncbi:uncharacterized protein A1O9_05201 [Exophiala aquamarina CBS 119918]|uniref:DnaJ homologue subfamily C member 28 conserved domain-containing protein n=1 Tax=Exophiala aquamarina CBS 119918 TaxID=1182545 RepID=A0A072PB42_9EURO|nr:uncharacterized protein A1O9_05201 [Exophiala aquamarina CBS 119918]KEF57284.1 hypothetical protein A1O9_05201 [Exophiala aquamarina CBS 119918]
MTRRLAEMVEETMDTGSKSDRKLMQDVGFSEDLKKQLEERIAQTAFEGQSQQAASQVKMSTSAGKGTQDIAAAQPWTGTETLHDSALRMLDDSHKKLRSTYKSPAVPHKSLRPAPKKTYSAADRLASARDKTSIYAFSQQDDMDEKEREKWRKELKERFTPGARPMPTTLQGLTSLANERIEDAIARGQFKNIPRGKGMNVERDYNANSPFLDTTEYFMNKIIQKQEIVPPWIEKQQELVKLVATFRGRLRNDWRRHAARSISSTGGSVAEQVRRARGFALAEEQVNPRTQKTETLSSISSDGSLMTVTVEERVAAAVPLEPQSAASAQEQRQSPQEEQVQITVTENVAGTTPASNSNEAPASAAASTTSAPSFTSQAVLPTPYPFRDADWERTELAYHKLAISEINALARSYNLMAPKIAQKPYYSLQRELNRCFAEVAPTLADAILERSRKPSVKIAIAPHKEGGILERFGNGVGAERYRGHERSIREESEGKGYGFREFWRDLFGGNGGGKKRDAV